MGRREIETALQFGAGNIGRGFMGQLFCEAGYRTLFVDTDEHLVRLLNEERGYTLRLLDAAARSSRDLQIGRVAALSPRQVDEVAGAFADAAVVATAVGMSNLEGVAAAVAAGIRRRRGSGGGPVDVYLCENSLHAAAVLRQAVYTGLDEEQRRWAQANVGFVGTIVVRMVPSAEERPPEIGALGVVADADRTLRCDRRALRASPPSIAGLTPVDNFPAEVERKLFSYNLAHAALAYLGYLRGYRYVHEPFADGRLSAVVFGALEETGRALTRKFPADLTPEANEEIHRDISLRFANPLIRDTVRRVARDPLRKLGPEERLVGSARLCVSQGVSPENVARVCGAALRYDDPQDAAAVTLQEMIRRGGVETALREICRLDPAQELGRKIVTAYQEARQTRRRQ